MKGEHICPILVIVGFLGGLDNLLLSLIIFVAVECLASALWFLSLYQFSIKFIVRWIANKCAIFLLIGIANTIDTFLIQSGESLRTIALWFYISYECIIILDNSKKLGLPIPEKLVDFVHGILKQSRKGKYDD